MSVSPQCAICGRKLHSHRWVCAPCRKQWQLSRPITEWPEWARFCKRDEEARRRDEQRRAGREIAIDSVPQDIYDSLAPNEGDQFSDYCRRDTGLENTLAYACDIYGKRLG